MFAAGTDPWVVLLWSGAVVVGVFIIALILLTILATIGASVMKRATADLKADTSAPAEHEAFFPLFPSPLD